MNKDNTSTSQNRKKKEAIVIEISEKTKKAKAFVFANYQGMTHQQLETLKRALKKVEADLLVTKNTLLNRSLKDNNLPEVSDNKGGTITLFAYNDVVAPIKELAKTIKLLKLPEVKSGILDGNSIDAGQVMQLATLPTRDVLIGQVVGGLKAPLFGLHRSLNWHIQKFVLTLKAVEQSKTS